MNVHFRFRSIFGRINGISFSSAFLFTAENENAFLSASSIHHKKVLVLVLKKVLITSLPSGELSGECLLSDKCRKLGTASISSLRYVQ